MPKTLLVIVGPTAVGKTELSLQIAEHLSCPIISADSRQVYSGLKIGTAAPTNQQLQRVRHYLVGHRQLCDYYSAWEFEQDVMQLLDDLFKTNDVVLMTGGSMMYIDAVCNGIDDIPTISEDVRTKVWNIYETQGLDVILSMLQQLDPQYYDIIDRQNYKRVIHAVEICLESGTTYTSLRTQTNKQRPFNIVHVGIQRERQQLFDRINQRVEQMIADGLEHEARSVFSQRHLNSLNTVGYKEMFSYFDGDFTLHEAIEKIKTNTRRYAKKQMTWFKNKGNYNWFDADDNLLTEKIISLLDMQNK